MTTKEIRRIFTDSLRLYFAPLKGAVQGASAESERAMKLLLAHAGQPQAGHRPKNARR